MNWSPSIQSPIQTFSAGAEMSTPGPSEVPGHGWTAPLAASIPTPPHPITSGSEAGSTTNPTQLPAAAHMMMSASYALWIASLTACDTMPPMLIVMMSQSAAMQWFTAVAITLGENSGISTITTLSRARTGTIVASGANPDTPSVTTPRSFVALVPCWLTMTVAVAVP